MLSKTSLTCGWRCSRLSDLSVSSAVEHRVMQWIECLLLSHAIKIVNT